MDPATPYADVVLKASTDDHLQILRGFADFWKVPYSLRESPRAAQVVMSLGQVPNVEVARNNPLVVSPAGLEDAKSISQRLGLELAVRKLLVRLPFSPATETSIETVLYEFKGARLETIIESNGHPLLSRVRSTNVHLLSTDLASEYAVRLLAGLEDSPSIKFRLATKLPLSYRMIPSFIRNRAFKSDGHEEIGEDKLGPIECLRTIFLASIATVSETPIPLIGFWKRGKKFALAVTHDVETQKGLLSGSQHLLRIEEDLQIRSTWNIITHRYHLTSQNLNDLAESGEIGGHDTYHDGRLIFLPLGAKIRRLRNCRETLERLARTKVKGFRAPLLQHDKELLRAVGKAGFEFDSSVPSWELLSPTSLRSHGVGTVFPFDVEGVVELPVSLPQDHQLLRVRSLSPAEAGNTMIRVSKWVRGIGGLCTLLIHPDYEFALEDEGTEYARILRCFREDPQCEIMTLGQAADWWSSRRKAYLESFNGKLIVKSTESGDQVKEMEVLAVTSYGPGGFTVEHLN